MADAEKAEKAKLAALQAADLDRRYEPATPDFSPEMDEKLVPRDVPVAVFKRATPVYFFRTTLSRPRSLFTTALWGVGPEFRLFCIFQGGAGGCMVR